MPFPEDEFNLMCALKGVGPTVVRRLEELGFSSLRQLGLLLQVVSLCHAFARR